MFDIQLLDTYREDNRLEAKKAKGGLPHSLWETYSAFVNADYYGRGGVVVRKHRDRLVFENPGTIRIGKEKMLEGGLSDPRNSVIIKMFSMLHIGERAGSGIHRIISAWSAAGYENPIIEEHIGYIERTTLTLPLTQASKGTQEMFKGTQESTQENGATDTSNGECVQKRGIRKVPRKYPEKSL